MADVTLHGSYLSGPTYKVALMLAMSGIPYNYRHVDLVTGEQHGAPFLALNRFGQVPVLTHGDVTLAQSNVIVSYLAQTFGRLQPPGTLRWRAEEWLAWEADKLFTGLARTRFFKKFIPTDPLIAKHYMKNANEALGVLEKQLAGLDFLVGSSLSYADVSLYATAWMAKDGQVDMAPYPNVMAWQRRVEAQPGFGGPREVLYKQDHTA
jgi:glutathione S-transferase